MTVAKYILYFTPLSTDNNHTSTKEVTGKQNIQLDGDVLTIFSRMAHGGSPC